MKLRQKLLILGLILSVILLTNGEYVWFTVKQVLGIAP